MLCAKKEYFFIDLNFLQIVNLLLENFDVLKLFIIQILDDPSIGELSFDQILRRTTSEIPKTENSQDSTPKRPKLTRVIRS